MALLFSFIPNKTKTPKDMRKVAIVTFIYALITTGWLVTGCSSGEESEKDQLAQEQQEAMNEADQAYDKIQNAEGVTDLSEVKEDLSETANELSEARKEYLNALQERLGKLNDRISELDQKLTDPNQANQPKWVSKRRELVRERDNVRANMMDLQKPMSDEQWVTAEEEIKKLLAAIDEQLKESGS
jgi:chromosome segregation ATPase